MERESLFAGLRLDGEDVTVLDGKDSRRVALTQLPEVVVSTVRLCIDHGSGGTPLWYETLVFPHDGKEITSWGEIDGSRYTTTEQAQEGHEKIVSRWLNRKGQTPVWDDDDE